MISKVPSVRSPKNGPIGHLYSKLLLGTNFDIQILNSIPYFLGMIITCASAARRGSSAPADVDIPWTFPSLTQVRSTPQDTGIITPYTTVPHPTSPSFKQSRFILQRHMTPLDCARVRALRPQASGRGHQVRPRLSVCLSFCLNGRMDGT